jgi:hypothetical protein
MMVADRNKLHDLLHQHQAWYPRMQVRDVYKLIYQGAMGPEHIIATQQEFAQRLEAEFNPLPTAPHERLLEAVRVDHSLLRLNLRPYKVHDQSINRLVPLLLKTSGQFHGSIEELVKNWGIFVWLCGKDEGRPFERHEIQRFSHWLEVEGYPPVHHSHVYRREYQPAYRLIADQLTAEIELSYAG